MQIFIGHQHGCCKLLSFSPPHIKFNFSSSRDNDITDILDETFTTAEERFGELVTIELKPGGGDIPVTEDNKKDYVDSVVAYRISRRVKEQFDSFMEGLLELIPRDLINVFDERELELLIGGMSEIDMYDLHPRLSDRSD